MNKLFATLGLCVVVPLFGMNEDKSLVIANYITKEESTMFVRHLGMAVGFGKKMMDDQIVPQNNPVYLSLDKLLTDLKQHNDDIIELVNSDTELKRAIDEYNIVDKDPIINFAIEQVRQKKGDVQGALDLVVLNRQIATGLMLQLKRPAYFQQWTGKVEREHRVDHMIRNAHYPTDEQALKDYIALFIYQFALAPKVVDKNKENNIFEARVNEYKATGSLIKDESVTK
jgi:hypothetical protein